MKIVTLTLNPAFDVHCFAENFQPYHESVAKITSTEAGGKGVNISRALTYNGVENVAVVVVGKENGASFCDALEKDGLRVVGVWTEGRIRENITLHERKNPETRISFDGFTCDRDILRQVEQNVGAVDEDTVVTFTGSIPKGISSAEVLAMLNGFREKGAKIVIDSRSVSLDELTAFKPWLIKPNKDEAEGYTGERIESVDDAAAFARKLHEKGVDNAVVSLGGDGAVLACAAGTFYAQTPSVAVVSTIGAGDSMIAGFLDGVFKELPVEKVLARAAAYGTAACMKDGTLPPEPSEVARLETRIQVKKLS